MPLSKNEAARLRRVVTSLHTVLDALHRAQGELYPEPLGAYREDVRELIGGAEAAVSRIAAELPSRRKQHDNQPDLLG
jgi:hypothetical protein